LRKRGYLPRFPFGAKMPDNALNIGFGALKLIPAVYCTLYLYMAKAN
jgi:hypothetical protein